MGRVMHCMIGGCMDSFSGYLYLARILLKWCCSTCHPLTLYVTQMFFLNNHYFEYPPPIWPWPKKESEPKALVCKNTLKLAVRTWNIGRPPDRCRFSKSGQCSGLLHRYGWGRCFFGGTRGTFNWESYITPKNFIKCTWLQGFHLLTKVIIAKTTHIFRNLQQHALLPCNNHSPNFSPPHPRSCSYPNGTSGAPGCSSKTLIFVFFDWKPHHFDPLCFLKSWFD